MIQMKAHVLICINVNMDNISIYLIDFLFIVSDLILSCYFVIDEWVRCKSMGREVGSMPYTPFWYLKK